ncbi:hypothetical protein Zmor_019771 [Zophobas morio]|uniref:Gustatory receptor n=1 Tax=Zophobas morio TaxID=2755281 RepID=A0AA38I2N8_9CUCU|nr:hypothetical protein Zmor_019771 [Zophobas morio]
MSFNLSIHDIDFLQNFFNYLQFFFVTPWYDIEKNCVRKPTYCRLYGCCILLLDILWFCACIIDAAAQQAIENLLPCQKVLYSLRTITLLLLVLFTILKNFWNFENWGTLFRNFHYVDIKLKNLGRKEPKILRNFYWLFLVKHVAFFTPVVYISCDMLINLKMTLLTILQTGSIMFVYYEFLVIVLWLSLIESFKARYESLNRKLVAARKRHSILEVRNLAQLYGILGETVETFNKLFGYQILLIIFHFMLELVICLNFFFFSFIPPKQAYNMGNPLASMLVMGYTVYNVVEVVFSTDNTTQAAKKFLYLICEMQDPFEKDFYNMEMLGRILNYCKKFVPDFNAAGFFSINKSIFLSIACNMASYFIISLQLHYAQIKDEGRRTKDEELGTKDQERRIKDEESRTKGQGRRRKYQGRRTKDQGRRTKDQGRRTKDQERRTNNEGLRIKDEERRINHEGRSIKNEQRRTKDQERRTNNEGLRIKDKGRKTKDDGRRTKNQGRRTKDQG